MKFISTKTTDEGLRACASEAMQIGLAPDGHLFVPESFPSFSPQDFHDDQTLDAIGARLLEPFFQDDPLLERVAEICQESFSFPIPLRSIGERTAVLELFHGPTAAFKDFGARFLARALSAVLADGEKLTIVVATSGDTGGAVAAAFHQRPGIEVFVLYPKGKVSARQEKQLTCWDENITTFAVQGDFDDCQRMVKAALHDPWWQSHKQVSSANSINIGRLLPQMVYYAAASLWYWREHGVEPGFVVPSGNLGNVCACIWARECGLPIGSITLATNANQAVSEFFHTGHWAPRPTCSTLATAMDVGDPSNMERLRHVYPDSESMREHLRAFSVTDQEIREQIREGEQRWGEVWCPHTACAAHVRELLEDPHQIVVATAHPAKFETIVEPLVGHEVHVPPELLRLLELPSRVTDLAPTTEALTEAVRALSE